LGIAVGRGTGQVCQRTRAVSLAPWVASERYPSFEKIERPADTLAVDGDQRAGLIRRYVLTSAHLGAVRAATFDLFSLDLTGWTTQAAYPLHSSVHCGRIDKVPCKLFR
jgi:hypothetical protein